MDKTHICFGQTETSILQRKLTPKQQKKLAKKLFDVLGLGFYNIICLISTNTAILYVQDKQTHLIERIESLFFIQYIPIESENCRIIHILSEDGNPVTEELVLGRLRKEFDLEVKKVELL